MEISMKSNVLKLAALVIVISFPAPSYAQTLGGLDENTAAPTVIVPPITPAPQTSPNAFSPIGANSAPFFMPSFRSRQFQGTGGRRR
jgi:hypothetical protein